MLSPAGKCLQHQRSLTQFRMTISHVGLYWNDLKDELVNTYLERKQPGESDFTTVAEIVSGTTNYFDEITALSDYRLRIEAAVRSEVEYSNTVTVELEQLPAAPTSLTCEVKSATSRPHELVHC